MTPISVDHGQVSQLLTFPFYESVSHTHTHTHTYTHTHSHPLNEVSDVLAFQEQGKSPETAFLQKLTEMNSGTCPTVIRSMGWEGHDSHGTFKSGVPFSTHRPTHPLPPALLYYVRDRIKFPTCPAFFTPPSPPYSVTHIPGESPTSSRNKNKTTKRKTPNLPPRHPPLHYELPTR